MCCGKKPSVFKAIQNFREEQKLSELELSRLKAGKFYSKVTDKELRIYFLCKNFKLEDRKAFLEGMIQNLEDSLALNNL
jgi:hypothetical protein